MSTALQKFTAQRVESAPVPLTIDDALRVGELMVMFDADGNKAHAVAKVLAGQELGIGPMASIRGFHMIKGKPSLSGELIATLIKRSGRYDFRSKVEADRATITIYDRGEALDPVTFTIEDAKTAGLTGNENYKKYAADMLFNRAVVRAARRHCPEVIGGAVYLESDEGIEYIDAGPRAQIEADPVTGEVIDSTATDSPQDYEAPDSGAFLISENQRRRMFAIARDRGIDSGRLKLIIMEQTGQDSTKAIRLDQYDALVSEIENPAPIDGQQTIGSDETLADELFAATATSAEGDA